MRGPRVPCWRIQDTVWFGCVEHRACSKTVYKQTDCAEKRARPDPDRQTSTGLLLLIIELINWYLKEISNYIGYCCNFLLNNNLLNNLLKQSVWYGGRLAVAFTLSSILHIDDNFLSDYVNDTVVWTTGVGHTPWHNVCIGWLCWCERLLITLHCAGEFNLSILFVSRHCIAVCMF